MGRVGVEHLPLGQEPAVAVAGGQEIRSPGQGKDGFPGLPGVRIPPVGPVGIAAQEVDHPPVQEPMDAAEGGFSEIPGEAAPVALEQDPLLHPLADRIGMGHNVPVSFRMGQDGQIAPELELVQQVPGFQGSGGGQQFHQKVGGAGQAVGFAFPGPGKVVEGVCIQAHLGPRVEADGDPGLVRSLLELGQPFRDGVPVRADAMAVEMGGGKKVPGPRLRRLAQHGQGHGKVPGTIVPGDVVQDVRVKVEHG